MNVEDNLSLLESLDQRNAQLRRRAAVVTWASVVAAGVVLVTLMLLGNRQLREVRTQVRGELQTLEQVRKQVREAETQRDEAKRELAAVRKQRDDAVENSDTIKANVEAITASESVAKLLPRVYLQIVNEKHRAYAAASGKTFQKAGFLVLGIEYVPKAAPYVKHTEVRYYKKAEAPTAERLTQLLTQNGDTGAKPVYLSTLENSTKVRANHFEVWFAPSDAPDPVNDREPGPNSEMERGR